MKLLATVFIVAVIALGSGQTPAGALSEFDKNFKLASEASAKNDMKEAKRLFELCLADAQSRKDAVVQARTLAELSDVANASGDPTLALADDEKALALREKIGKVAGIGATLHNIGHDLYFLGQFDKALDYFLKALAMEEKIGNPGNIAQCLNSIGADYASLGRFDEALNYHRQALALRGKIGDPSDIASSINNVGADYNSLGQFDKALDCFQRALAMRKRVGNPADIALSLYNIGATSSSLGRFDKALDYFQQALSMQEQIGDPAYIAWSLGGLGVCYDSLGQFDKALECNQKALAIQEKVGNPAGIAWSLDGIAANYSSLGRFDEALECNEKALALREKIGNPAEIALSLNNVGSNYNSLDRLNKSLEHFQTALAMREKIGNPSEIAQSLNDVGLGYASLGQFERAVEWVQKALAVRERIGNPADIARSLNNVGSVFTSLGQFDKGLEYARKGLAMREKIGNPVDIAGSVSDIGVDFTSLGRYAEAEQAYARAVKMYEDSGGQVGAPSELGAFQAGQMGDLYGRFAALRVKEGHEPEGLAIADRGHAQGLSRQIAMQDETLQTILSREDAKALEDVHRSFVASTAKLRALDEKAEQADGRAKVAIVNEAEAAKGEVAEAELKYGLERDAMFTKYPDFKLVAGEQPLSGPQMVQLGRHFPDTLFLEFALEGDKLLSFAICGAKGLSVTETPLKAAQLRADVKAYLAAIASNSRNEEGLARGLYSQILGPVGASLNDPAIKRLCVVADGPLLDVPFASLMDANGKRLIERFAVSNAVSLGSLRWRGASRDPSRAMLVVADPTGEGSARVESTRGGFGSLPGAKVEGEQIAQEVPGSTALYGGAATESEVKKEMPSYALLHFACHGYLDSAQAMHSALVMAKDSQGDGFIEAEDLLSIPLSAQLAVLSACETGEGLQSGGEGLMGLTWAFQAAGVPAVVASKWQVDDKSTARMMVTFYKELLKGARKDDAFRTAMLAEMKLEEAPSPGRSISVAGPVGNRANPYYWAAFQVIGDCSPLKPLPK